VSVSIRYNGVAQDAKVLSLSVDGDAAAATADSSGSDEKKGNGATVGAIVGVLLLLLLLCLLVVFWRRQKEEEAMQAAASPHHVDGVQNQMYEHGPNPQAADDGVYGGDTLYDGAARAAAGGLYGGDTVYAAGNVKVGGGGGRPAQAEAHSVANPAYGYGAQAVTDSSTNYDLANGGQGMGGGGAEPTYAMAAESGNARCSCFIP
jgi:hypothetical protein